MCVCVCVCVCVGGGGGVYKCTNMSAKHCTLSPPKVKKCYTRDDPN